MGWSFVQDSFLGGEWSQAASGNVSDPRYKTAMARSYNGIPVEPGLWTRRPGSQLSAPTKGGAQGRVIDWNFKENVPVTVEFTAGNARFHIGPRLSTTNDAQTVSSISTDNPAVVTTAAAHGWVTDDQVYFSALGTSDPFLLNRQFSITVTGTTTFTIADAVTGSNIDGSALATFTTGTIARISDLVVPYTTDQVLALRSVQAEEQSVLLHQDQQTEVLTATVPSGDDPVFTVAAAQFVDGPYLDPVVGATLTPASANGIVGFTMQSPDWSSTDAYNTGDYVTYSGSCYKSNVDSNVGNEPDTATLQWQSVSQDSVIGGLTTDLIGRHIRLFSEPEEWASGTTYSAGDSVKYNNAYWASVVASNEGNTPGLDATKWAPQAAAAQWTWGKISALTGATITQVDLSSGVVFSAASYPGMSIAGTTPEYAFDGLINGNAAIRTAHVDPSYLVAGIYLSAGTKISFVKVYAPTNSPFSDYNGPNPNGTVTLKLYGKTSAPTTDTDGTLLGTASNVTNTTGAVVQINSTDASTTYEYIWVRMEVTNLIGSDQAFLFIGEVQVFTATSFSGTGLSVQIYGPPILHPSVPIEKWRLGLLWGSNPNPACGTYHEGRLWLSGVVDNRLDASALVDINDDPATSLFYFTPTLYDGTVNDACAIDYPLDGPDINAVFWMEPTRDGIQVGTQAGEWLVQATNNNNILTPTSIQAHRVTKIGCANIEPCHSPLTLIFVQRFKRFVQEYFADVFSGRFTSPNIAVNSKHLTAPSVEEVRFQTNIAPIVWARRSDGVLVGCSYKRDSLFSSQGPTYAGWHQHALGHGRSLESISVGASPATPSLDAGASDTLAMVTKDADTGYYYVEFLTKIPEETDAGTDAWYVDGALIATTTQGAVSGDETGMRCDGLWPLNGKTVSVFCGGYDCGDFAVSNGSCFVPYDTTFTQAVATAAPQTIVGFTYTSEGQLLPPDTPQESGVRTGSAFGKVRRLSEYAVALINTGVGIAFGTDFSRLNVAQLRSAGGSTALVEPALYTGTHRDTIDDAARSFTSQICWRITRPYPALISTIAGFNEIKE